jgi:hypothetical protein
MRKRLLPTCAAMALALGILTAAPAAAAITVASITFPGGASEFYSPFSGPASIRFEFTGDENNANFEVRLRPVGGSAVFTKSGVYVTPDAPETFEIKDVAWPALSVTSAREYVVAVYRNGTQVASDRFLLQPRLVSITGATPNPFFPWIDDGYKDTTRIRFSLVADAEAEARVFKPNSSGKCCGPLIRDDQLSGLAAGANHWVWDGRGEGLFAGTMAKGNYFVKIWADDGTLPPAVSKPFKVSIARTYRATKTTSKAATKYHHVGPITPLIAAGDCRIYVYDGVLRILCQTAKVTVYWRWGLSSDERIEKASFVIDNPTTGCPSSIRSVGHTKHESSFTVNDDVAGISASCRVSKAKITYSFPRAS